MGEDEEALEAATKLATTIKQIRPDFTLEPEEDPRPRLVFTAIRAQGEMLTGGSRLPPDELILTCKLSADGDLELGPEIDTELINKMFDLGGWTRDQASEIFREMDPVRKLYVMLTSHVSELDIPFSERTTTNNFILRTSNIGERGHADIDSRRESWDRMGENDPVVGEMLQVWDRMKQNPTMEVSRKGGDRVTVEVDDVWVFKTGQKPFQDQLAEEKR
jgi:hypothetical protein